MKSTDSRKPYPSIRLTVTQEQKVGDSGKPEKIANVVNGGVRFDPRRDEEDENSGIMLLTAKVNKNSGLVTLDIFDMEGCVEFSGPIYVLLSNIYNKQIREKKKELNEIDITKKEKETNNTLTGKSGTKNPTLIKPTKKKRKRIVPVYIQPYLDYWNEKGTMKHTDTSTDTFKQIIQTLRRLLKGTMYNDMDLFLQYKNHAFTFAEFKVAVDRLNTAATSPLHLPRNKSTMKPTLPNFLFNKYARTQETLSLFLHFLDNKPKRLVPEDDALTKALIHLYTKNVLGGVNVKISVDDHKKFLFSSSQLKTFFADNKRNLSPHFNVTAKRMANWLWNAICSDVGDSMTITPGFFSSNATFSKRLPAYLKKQSILLGAPKKKSISQLTEEARRK